MNYCHQTMLDFDFCLFGLRYFPVNSKGHVKTVLNLDILCNIHEFFNGLKSTLIIHAMYSAGKENQRISCFCGKKASGKFSILGRKRQTSKKFLNKIFGRFSLKKIS